jgi:hypothetical protein
MAVVPSRRTEERSLAHRGGDPFSYLRNQVNRMFSNFWEGSSLEPSRETRAAAFWSQVDVTETDKEIKTKNTSTKWSAAMAPLSAPSRCLRK